MSLFCVFDRGPGLVLYRVQVFRVRVEYESAGVEYESSTSRVIRIHSQKWGLSLKNDALSPTFFTFYCIFIIK